MRSLVQERLEDHQYQDHSHEQKEQVLEEPEKKQQTDPKLEAARLRLGEIPSSLYHLKGHSHENEIFVIHLQYVLQ
jgi:hypothetical protein